MKAEQHVPLSIRASLSILLYTNPFAMNTRINRTSQHLLLGVLLISWMTNAYGQEKPLFKVRQQQAANTATNTPNQVKPVVPDQ
jgi:hypothetical protein